VHPVGFYYKNVILRLHLYVFILRNIHILSLDGAKQSKPKDS